MSPGDPLASVAKCYTDTVVAFERFRILQAVSRMHVVRYDDFVKAIAVYSRQMDEWRPDAAQWVLTSAAWTSSTATLALQWPFSSPRNQL